MSALITTILFILYAALVVFIIYLILLVVKLRFLVDDVREVVRNQVTPTLNESKEAISKFNDVGTQVKKVTETISHAVGAVGNRKKDSGAPAMGQKLGFQLAKKAAILLAGLSKAKEAVHSEKKAAED